MLIICYVQVCKVISYIIPFKPQQCMQNRYCFNLILQIRRVELRGSENFRHFPKVSNIRLLINCAFNILTLQKRKLRLGKVEEKRAHSGSSRAGRHWPPRKLPYSDTLSPFSQCISLHALRFKGN